MKRVFTSHFREPIERLIEQKHALGFPYKESIRLLFNFDQFCMENFPHETELTQEIGLKWAQKRSSEKNNGFRNRLMPVRELARYMNRIGMAAYVIPVDLAQKGARYIPHIYTREELSAIFAVLDQTPYKRNFPVRHLVIPVIFRVIYCCGLRPSEARKFKVQHVDLEIGRLHILESKGHKDRMVMLSDDVLELCKKYHEQVHNILPEREYFFPDSSGKLYTKGWMIKIFRTVRAKAGIQFSGGTTCRAYDFRYPNLNKIQTFFKDACYLKDFDEKRFGFFLIMYDLLIKSIGGHTNECTKPTGSLSQTLFLHGNQRLLKNIC